MTLSAKITEAMKAAMKEKRQSDLKALRAIKAAFMHAKTELPKDTELSEDQEMKILQKLAKQRKESAEIYKRENRAELAAEEESELKVIEQFLPTPMSEKEIEDIVSKIVKEEDANSMADMGKVMQKASKVLAGKADGKAISAIVKKILNP